jgi:hypothetical protein
LKQQQSAAQFPPGQQRVRFSEGQHHPPRALRSIPGQQFFELRIEFLAALGKLAPFEKQARFPFSTFGNAFRQ